MLISFLFYFSLSDVALFKVLRDDIEARYDKISWLRLLSIHAVYFTTRICDYADTYFYALAADYSVLFPLSVNFSLPLALLFIYLV